MKVHCLWCSLAAARIIEQYTLSELPPLTGIRCGGRRGGGEAAAKIITNTQKGFEVLVSEDMVKTSDG